MDNIPRGTAFFLLSLVFFVSLDSLAKHLTQIYSPVEVAWGRYIFAVILLPVFLTPRRMIQAARTSRPWLQSDIQPIRRTKQCTKHCSLPGRADSHCLCPCATVGSTG